MKGMIQDNHIPKNNYELQVIGLPSLTLVEVSEISEEINKIKLPDRTQASGGQKTPGDFTGIIPAHHDVEIAAMEAWYKEGQDPVAPTYKKTGLLILKTLDGNVGRTYTFSGCWVSARSIQAVSLENEGEMEGIQYTFNYDDILPTS
jgi:hypothetical protein